MLRTVEIITSVLTIITLALCAYLLWINFKKKRIRNIRFLIGIFGITTGVAYFFQAVLDIDIYVASMMILFFSFGCMSLAFAKWFPNE